MSAIITAIYEQGVLRPLHPVPVPEHARVILQVQEVSTPDETLAHRAHLALVAAGLSITAADETVSTQRLSEQRREALAQLFSTGGPLSALILEERAGR